MSTWTDLVSKIYKEKRIVNANYSLKDAMKDAKKEYKPNPTKNTKPTKQSKNKSKKNTHNRSSRKK
jgi:hypothetical protein